MIEQQIAAAQRPAPGKRHSRYWPDATRRLALDLRALDVPVSRISKRIGVPMGTVRRWVYGEAA